jgi:DNA polymerase elongation subunit (family B)
MATFHYSISWVISIVTCLVILVGCKDQTSSKDISNVRSNFMVELENSFIKNTIKEYANENQLDTAKAIITVNVKTTTYDTAVYINRIITEHFQRYPTYYSIVDNYLVFIYTDIDRFVDNPSIKDEVHAVIYQKNIMLDTTIMINDTPTLKISRCANRVLREFEADELELPCFLEIVEENGELKLIKKK